MTRERAIEVLKAWNLNWSDSFTANEFEQSFAMAISALSADVRENKGEWIPKERPTECSLYIDIVCSECGYVGFECYAYGYELNEIDMKKARDFTKELNMNYCTCCGCSMDKAESEEI